MAQYGSVNVGLSSPKLHKSKSTTKNVTGVTLRLTSNMIPNSSDETANRQVANLYTAFAKYFIS